MQSEGIEYCVKASRLGRLLVAGSARGVCFVRFGSCESELVRRLAAEFAFAEVAPASGGRVSRWAERIAATVDGRNASLEVPLDVRGSRFQMRVWNALGRIPRGGTRAYSDVAAAIGAPGAARAVARACASNPALVVVPCHRVTQKSGGVGGYAGGVGRKTALLEAEGALLAGATRSKADDVRRPPRTCRHSPGRRASHTSA